GLSASGFCLSAWGLRSPVRGPRLAVTVGALPVARPRLRGPGSGLRLQGLWIEVQRSESESAASETASRDPEPKPWESDPEFGERGSWPVNPETGSGDSDSAYLDSVSRSRSRESEPRGAVARRRDWAGKPRSGDRESLALSRDPAPGDGVPGLDSRIPGPRLYLPRTWISIHLLGFASCGSRSRSAVPPRRLWRRKASKSRRWTGMTGSAGLSPTRGAPAVHFPPRTGLHGQHAHSPP